MLGGGASAIASCDASKKFCKDSETDGVIHFCHVSEQRTTAAQCISKPRLERGGLVLSVAAWVRDYLGCSDYLNSRTIGIEGPEYLRTLKLE